MTVINPIPAIRTSLEQLLYAVFDQQGTAQYPHDLENGSAEAEVVLDNGDEAICDDGHMNLYPDSVLGLAPEGLDSEMLLDPLEKEFHLPAVAVKQGDVLGGKIEVVCVVDERPSEVWCVVDDTPEVGRVVSLVPPAGEADGLVEQDIVLPVDRLVPSDNLEVGVSLLADDEERPDSMYGEEPRKVKVSAVEDIAGVGLVCEPIHRLVVADIGVCDTVEYRYLGDDVNLGVYADAGLGAAEMCPSENRHAEVDGCGVHGIETSVKFKLLGDSSLLCKGHHVECILLENPGVAEHVCLREGVSDNWLRAESKLVASFGMGFRNVGKFAKAPASNKLSEDEDKHVAPMGESPVPGPVIILVDNPPEPLLRKKHRDLRKNVLSVVHPCLVLVTETRKRISSPGQYFVLIKNCA